jgi:regulator of protease activity HflC (stomatin/prohibitin superfamily)
MFGIKRIVIAQHQRGLKWRNGRFETVLEPGVTWVFDPYKRVQIELFDLTVAEFEHPKAGFLLAENRDAVERHFDVVEIGIQEVGVVFKDGQVAGVLAPGTRQVYWRGPTVVRVEKFDISTEFELPSHLARLVGNGKVNGLGASTLLFEVPDTAAGLLIVNGQFVREVTPGVHAYWRFQRTAKVELIDKRVQTMEVQGQEILTRDKVSLRVNLTALWQIVDPVKARRELQNVVEFVYKEMQFALREAVGTRTLDELLAGKGALDGEVETSVRARVEAHGVAIHSVGIKDVILPGDMKEIMNRVVAAEKAAQANLIKRREETAATRSLLNTARLMDENPTLMRLKELETLEAVTSKIDKMTVFGGLDGVLKDVVRIQVPSAS